MGDDGMETLDLDLREIVSKAIVHDSSDLQAEDSAAITGSVGTIRTGDGHNQGWY